MISAGVGLALILSSPPRQCLLEVLDGFLGHALIVDRVTEVEFGPNARKHEMGLVDAFV
jgi:hypothetical protein